MQALEQALGHRKPSSQCPAPKPKPRDTRALGHNSCLLHTLPRVPSSPQPDRRSHRAFWPAAFGLPTRPLYPGPHRRPELVPRLAAFLKILHAKGTAATTTMLSLGRFVYRVGFSFSGFGRRSTWFQLRRLSTSVGRSLIGLPSLHLGVRTLPT